MQDKEKHKDSIPERIDTLQGNYEISLLRNLRVLEDCCVLKKKEKKRNFPHSQYIVAYNILVYL